MDERNAPRIPDAPAVAVDLDRYDAGLPEMLR
jgi:hypothetical protein